MSFCREHGLYLLAHLTPTAPLRSPTADTPKRSSVDEESFSEFRRISTLPEPAPLLCAGITTYSPMRHWNVTAGKKVGVVGLGGLGHMAVKFARAFGGLMSSFLRRRKAKGKTHFASASRGRFVQVR